MDRTTIQIENYQGMKTLRIFFFALLALTIAAPLNGQQRNIPNVPSSLTMDDAISLGTRWNPGHRQIANNRGPAAWGVRNSFANFLPSLTVNGGYGITGAGVQNFGTTEFRSAPTQGSSYGINLNWSLDANTLVQPGLQRAQLHSAEASILSSEITIATNIARQYLVVLQAQDEVELAEAVMARNDEAVRLAEARRGVGQGTLLNLRQAQVVKGQSEVRLLQERQDIRVEKLRLFELMGISSMDNMESVALTDSFPVERIPYGLEELLSLAHSENPQLNSLRSTEASAGWGVTSAKVNWYPRITANMRWSGFTQGLTNTADVDNRVLNAIAQAAQAQAACQEQNSRDALLNTIGGSFTPSDCTGFGFTPSMETEIRSSATPSIFDFRRNPFSFSVGISIPIFSNFSRPLQVSQAHAQQEDAREAVRALELQLETNVSQAYYQMETNFQTIAIQERNRVAAGEALRLATEQYRLGSGGYIALQDAQVAAEQAEFDYIQALYTFHQSIAALEASVGRHLR